MRIIGKIFIVLFTFSALLTSCREEKENKVEDAVEEVGDGIEDAADEVEDAADEVEDAVE
ncbi:hypothetical protein [Flavisericum labens]|uniref:hypothetical protein n=1 Tax=Flavisericum labens TaxID=3377112 RepID=UPI00387AB82E